MEVLQWTICLILAVPSALLILLNWLSFIGWLIAVRRGHKGGHSFAPPFVCGIAGAIACLICPWPGVWRWAWIPPLADPSIGLLLVCCVMNMIARLTGFPSPFDGQSQGPPVEQMHTETDDVEDGGGRSAFRGS